MRRDSTAGRGQTAQDFAIGVSVFLVATAFTFAFVPNVTQPFDVGTSDAQQEQADRVSDAVVANLSIPGRRTHLNTTRTGALFASSPDDLRERFALPTTTQLNVSLRETGPDGAIRSGYAVGTVPSGETATATRIVYLDGTAGELVVRVW
jgi:hypothetical protein